MTDTIRLLYAEDNGQDADLTQFHFAEHAPDFEVEIVTTGEACLNRLRVEGPDLLLLDHHLPDMDGLEVLRRIVRGGGRLPVVLVTGVGDEDLAVRALRLGAANYVPKQGDYLATLPGLLRAVLERQRLRSGEEPPEALPNRVLYVEHDANDIDLTLQHFAEAAPSLQVEIARTAREALVRLAGPPSLDAVVIDLRLPDMSGLDLVREAGGRSVLLPPFIMVTGKGDEAAAVASLKIGAADYVSKRTGYLDDLVYLIDRAIAHERLRRLNGHLRVELAQRRRVEESLKEANDRLAEADHRKNEFIAILSHELRNPLAPIRYAVPLLRRSRLDGPATRAAAVIERQVGTLARLVDDLLDVSRITSGKIELRRESVRLDSVLESVVEAASPAITAARHTLTVTVAGPPIWLHADAARVAQIVTNLLDNSIKFTPRGGRIALETGCQAGQAVIRVRDDGIGIPRAALATVFDMFHQVTTEPSLSKSGLGIGLALVRRLAELHGGSVEAHSEGEGRGAEFVVRLPSAAEPRARETTERADADAAAPRRLKVLVVDDNADLVAMLRVAVADLGHDVRTALDGASAIAAACAYCPDVVLLDLGLPVITGMAVARELRRMPETARVRLVALTGWGQPEDRRETAAAGFDHHLTKPTDPKQLERVLAGYASRARGESL